MAINRQVGTAMGTQLDRVNSKTQEQFIEELQRQIRALQARLDNQSATIEAQADELNRRGRASTYGISADGRAVVTPSEFARIHGTTVPTVNRALNNTGEGRRLQGQQLPNGHWLVYADQVFEPTHRGRRKKD